MNIARQVATRSTCDRKHVGAVIVRDKTILSTDSEDDDMCGARETLLRRAGYGVGMVGGREGVLALAVDRPDVLVLDRDLPPDVHEQILERLASSAGRSSCPLVVIGGGASPRLPKDWHEDAFASVARPPD